MRAVRALRRCANRTQWTSDFGAAKNADPTFCGTTKEVAVRRFRLTNAAKAFSAFVVTGVVSLTF